jgi:hypothetical protein
MSENVDSLTVYCRDDKRVCPLPKAWQQLWEMPPEKRRAVDAWEPAVPLIGRMAGRSVSAGLREDEWHHLGE